MISLNVPIFIVSNDADFLLDYILFEKCLFRNPRNFLINLKKTNNK